MFGDLLFALVKKEIMRKLIIVLFFLPNLLYSQDKINYDIYSFLINNSINQYNKKAIKILVVDDSLMIDRSLLNLENQMGYFKINDNDPIYDSLPDFPKNSEIESLLNIIVAETKFPVKNKLETDRFKINKPLKLIDSINRIKLNKSKDYWKQFYKLYPNSLGMFSFSPIFYSGRLAAIFIVHRLRDLAGTGYLMIMQKKEPEWEIVIPIRLWIS